jgi:hypothetical protein
MASVSFLVVVYFFHFSSTLFCDAHVQAFA